MPAHVLAPGRAAVSNRWAVSQYVSDLPGRLIAQGYYVAIATRAPLAYASTLIELLGLDTHELLASCGNASTKGQIVSDRLTRRGIKSSSAIYVGDEPQDELVAEVAGTDFASAIDLASGELEGRLNFLRYAEPLHQWGRDPTGNFENDGGTPPEMASLRWMLRNRIPDPDAYLPRLKTVLSEADPLQKATLCMQTLIARPGISTRRDLQLALFEALPEGAGPCVLRLCEAQGLFGARPAFLTKAEARRDKGLRDAYGEALARMYPAQTRLIPNLDEDDWPIVAHYLRPYRGRFGNRLQKIKDYGGTLGSRYHSRSNNEFGGLELIADMMSTTVPRSVDAVVPIPSSPFSHEQPAEVSYRLARLVAERSALPYVELLERRGDEFAAAPDGRGKSVLLLDDQITRGNSIQRAVRALESSGHRVTKVVAYSSSEVSETYVQTQCPLSSVNTAMNLQCLCGRPMS